jgi:F0F1-type ATP synthase membrane subunit b/b'
MDRDQGSTKYGAGYGGTAGDESASQGFASTGLSSGGRTTSSGQRSTGSGSFSGSSSGGQASSTAAMSDLASQTKQAVGETAQQTVETAKSAAQEIAGTAQEQATQAIDQVVSQTVDTVSQVKEQAGSVFMDQRDRAVAGLSSLADALREASRTLANQADGNGASATMSPFIEDVAHRLSSSADFLREKDVRQILDEAEDLARRQPVMFAGALFAVGVVGARLLKGTMMSADGQSSSMGVDGMGTGRSTGSTNRPDVGATWSSGAMSETGSRATGGTTGSYGTSQEATKFENSGGAGSYGSGRDPYRSSTASSGSTAGDWGGVDVRPQTPDLTGEPS